MPPSQPPIAYFCAEFGIDTNIPTYAGGLGILAGDTLLEAGIQNFPMVGIGLLYQGRKFLQHFDENGWQFEEPSNFYADGTACLRRVETEGRPVMASLVLDGEEVWIKAYNQRLGDNTSLYLLTTDIGLNTDEWRDIMASDYCCEQEIQLRQQLILGIGGVNYLEKLGIKPALYHFQEGRPIFGHWEIARQISLTEKTPFSESLALAKEKIVYTNHTLVPDGNLIYDTALVSKYANGYAQDNDASPDDLLAPGIAEHGFSITQYALKTSTKQSAVSEPHGELSKKNWPEYKWETITNGVHMGRWQVGGISNPSLPDSELWAMHNYEKSSLQTVVKRRSGFDYDSNRLIIGWARRITGYKQIEKIFENTLKLAEILKNQDMPIQLLIAGKAHPGDDAGKAVIQKIMRTMGQEVAGHALYIPNYDIVLARNLVAGCDVWLNTPEFGKEASGTSGMKAASNGVLNATVADGWAAEVNWEGKGWVLDHQNVAESFYSTLKNQIAPLFYNRNQEGFPGDWVQMMKNSIKMSENYSTKRVLTEYQKKLYS